MPRVPFQVLVLPFTRIAEEILYAIFRTRDGNYWQFIAGGGEKGESLIEAACREAREEAGIPEDSALIALDSFATIPVPGVTGGPMQWGDGVLLIPEYCFGVELKDGNMVLSNEHVEYHWSRYEEARDMLKWDSNKTALWELNYRIENGRL